jgi:hypothetical protein
MGEKLSLRITDDTEVCLSISLHIFVDYMSAKLAHLLDYSRFVLQIEDIIVPPCASDCDCHNMQNVSDNITLDYLNWVIMKNFGGTDDETNFLYSVVRKAKLFARCL